MTDTPMVQRGIEMISQLFQYQGQVAQAEGFAQLERNRSEHNETLRLLDIAGPGHMVVRARWRDRDGAQMTVTEVFPVFALPEDIDEWERSQGWPGHDGAWWRYVWDDIRLWWARALP